MTITLKPNKSPSLPVLAEWKIGTGKYSDAYSSKKEAVDYLTGRFGKVKFIDKLPDGE